MTLLHFGSHHKEPFRVPESKLREREAEGPERADSSMAQSDRRQRCSGEKGHEEPGE